MNGLSGIMFSELLSAISLAATVVFSIVIIVLLISSIRNTRRSMEETAQGMERAIEEGVSRIKAEQLRIAAEGRDELARTATGLREDMARETEGMREDMSRSIAGLREDMGRTFSEQAMQNEQKLDNIRKTMEDRIGAMQEGNERQLNRMRETVDEKLQETLNTRISESFRTVQSQLTKVSEGLGEMQALAADVGGLKNVLSNVKTKGILGEYQLAAILEEILSREQYDENIATKENSLDRVEFAVRLPGDPDIAGDRVHLPIDAKFPSVFYAQLMSAYEAGDPQGVEDARKALTQSAKQSARMIHDKYIDPPRTTDFAIMFLPTEGLYAEIVNMGLVEELQRMYKVVIAGPTTMAALLNSFQMGFKTLAIQKRSSEVWNVLGAVKTEFGKFETVLNSARNRMRQADDDLEKLIGTRTNAINRKLRSVAVLSDETNSVQGEFSMGTESGDAVALPSGMKSKRGEFEWKMETSDDPETTHGVRREQGEFLWDTKTKYTDE